MHKPANKQKFEVKVNVKPSYRETLKESRTSNVKVDKQKIDEFFHPASKKSSVSSPVIEDNFEGLPESVFPPETSVHSVSGNTSSHHSYSEENIDDFPTENQE